jgi:hypothetical protein
LCEFRWAHSAVVARPLCKRKAPGSIPGVSILFASLAACFLRPAAGPQMQRLSDPIRTTHRFSARCHQRFDRHTLSLSTHPTHDMWPNDTSVPLTNGRRHVSSSSIHRLLNPPTSQPTNFSIHRLLNPPASQPTNFSTHQLLNPPTSQPTNSTTHQLYNPPTLQPTSSSTQQLLNPTTLGPRRVKTCKMRVGRNKSGPVVLMQYLALSGGCC